MQTKIRKRLQKSIALAAITSFMVMPVNFAVANNNITAGNSGVGGMTNITGGQGNVTDITGGFVNGNGTGFNHFNDFQIGQGGTANLHFGGANKFVNLVNNQIDIQGTFNALKGGGYGNVIFISPQGMVVGASGVMNVGSLQAITPSAKDYNALLSKAGSADGLTAIQLTEAEVNALKAGGDGIISVGGKILSTGNVDLQAGNGIYFRGDGIIDTTKAVGNDIGDIALFTNTGDIVGSGALNIDASGNITLSAKNGGIGSGIVSNPVIYGEDKTVTPINVKVAEGKKLNVEVSDKTGEANSFKGFASVSNGSTNLQLGSVKGSNIKIVHEGAGTLKTTEEIKDVDKIYLKATKGDLNVKKDITAKNIVRLAAGNSIDAAGNLTVTDAGYISVYADKGSINMNDATLKSGNIDIKANGIADEIDADNGSVTHGNITVSERGNAEGTLRLVDDQVLSTGIKAPDTYRFDGVHITSKNNNINQKDGTKINSAGRTDLTAAGSVNSTIKSYDVITVAAGKDANLTTIDTARLGDVQAQKINVKGDTILVDGSVKGNTIDINANDKVVIRPDHALDANHKTYGKIEAVNDVNIKAENGIQATQNSPYGTMIASKNGNVVLTTNGDIVNLAGADAKISVGAKGKVDAKGNNINIQLADANGNVGTIDAKGNANIGADGDVNILDKIAGGNNVTVTAEGFIHQTATSNNPAIISGKDMKLVSNQKDVGDPNDYLQVKVGGKLDASAPKGGVYIGSKDNITIGQIAAGKNVGIESDGYIHQTDSGTRPAIIAGENLHLLSKTDNVGDPNNYLTVSVGNKLDAAAPNGGVYIYGYGNLTTDKVEAGKDIYIGGNKDIIIPHDKENGNIIAGGNVTIEAGDNVTNGGGSNVGIVAGGDITITANTNKNTGTDAGHIGDLPYNDLNHSINVALGGNVKGDELGIPQGDKIINIHIMGQNNGGNGNGTGNGDDGFSSDDNRDQRNMKFLTDDKGDETGARGQRQDLRYNVANSEYVFLNSDADSNAKVVDVLNISKQGMLVETTEAAKLGETMKISMDYKGLPFTVEGEVVRVDPVKNTAGIKFSNIDQLTSSMILYLGMTKK